MLYQILSEHLESFLARLDEQGARLPAFVTHELRRFLECGIRAYGFMRVWCPECRFGMAVPFSCKGRGFCPSCGGRFMAQTAAHLVDHVLADVPYRQWVLTLPFELRYRVAFDPNLQTIVLRTFLRTLDQWQRRRAQQAGVSDPRWGAVTVVQRFNSALQLSPHLHTLGIDGIFALDAQAERARFRALPPPTDEDVAQLVREIATRVVAALERRGLLSSTDPGWAEPDPHAQDEPAIAACYGAAIQGRLAFGEGAGERVPRLGADPSAPFELRTVPLQARARGFDLHAGVAVPAGRREQLERLVRYMARPPLSNDRLELLPDGRVALRLKRAFSDGSTHAVYSPEGLLERLCALIPRPRTHRVRYHGVFASASPFRRLVVPQPPAESDEPSSARDATGQRRPESEPSDRTRFRWILWAALLQRVFDVDSLACPNCSGRMRVIAAILKADVVAKILQSLGLPAEPPEIRRARPPPESGLVEHDLC